MAKQEQSFIATKGKQFTKRNQFGFNFIGKQSFIAAKGESFTKKKINKIMSI
jgi:hypothetical protein